MLSILLITMNSSLFSLLFVIFTGTLGLDEKCTKNSDCPTINSLCINGGCACDDLSYYSNETKKCLQYVTEYNAVCYEDTQCEWLKDNFKCRNNRCVCQENYRWYKGECQKYVGKGGQCESNDECYTGYDLLSLTCSRGKCDCSSNYYSRGNDCRKSSFVLGDCALDLDCQSSLLECTLGKCSLKPSNSSKEQYLEVHIEKAAPTIKVVTYRQEGIACEDDSDCRNMANSICDISNKKCGCNEATHYEYNGNCVQGLSRCDSVINCTSTNTMCFKNTSCICQPGFFLKDGKCVAELGMLDPHAEYEADSDCPIKPGQLIGSVCYCKNYWFNDESNRNCIKTMIQSTLSCLTNEWCSAMGPYSICNSTTNKCQCSSPAKFNETTYYCDLISDFSGICLRDNDCGINERCLDEKCECAENFSRDDKNACVPNIGASCAIESCSHVENAYCLGGTCTCANHYIGKETVCLKIADSLGAPCEAQEQCQDIKFAVCGEPDAEYETAENQTLQCVCEEGYTDVNNMCYQIKKYGDPCMTEAECTMVLNRSYKCRNSQCQCGVGLSLKNGYCSSASGVILTGSLLWVVLLVKLGLC